MTNEHEELLLWIDGIKAGLQMFEEKLKENQKQTDKAESQTESLKALSTHLQCMNGLCLIDVRN